MKPVGANIYNIPIQLLYKTFPNNERNMFPCTTGVVQFKLLNIEKGSHKYKQGQDSATGFIRTTLALRVAVPTGAIPIILKADNHCVSEDDATAKAMRYWHDAILVDVTKYPRRAGEAGSGQFCYNCQLYKKSYTRELYKRVIQE